MAFRGLALLLSVILTAVGCSLLTSIPDVTSGNGQPPADAAADANANAATSGGDGGAEAGSRFCAAQTPPSAFCDDFDEGTDLLPRWETEGVVQVDSATPRSPPNSVFAGSPAAGSCKYSIIRKSFGPSYRASRLAFAFYLGAPLSPAAGSIAGQSLLVGDTRCQVGLSVEPGSPAIYEQILTPAGDVLHTAHDLPTIADGAWHDVTIDYDPDAKIIVTLDGATVLSEGVAQSCPPGRGAWLTSLGWHCLDNAPAGLSVHVDNVTFDPR